MDVSLSDGTIVSCEDRPFASGGDGDIYWSKGRTHVIKQYQQPDPHRRQSLELILGKYNIVKEDPLKEPFFAWPDAIVVAPRLGVRMPTRNLRGIERITKPKFWATLPTDEKGSFAVRVAMAYRAARAIKWLHGRGLCHSDISDKNIMASAKDATTCIIDCDGLVVKDFTPAQVYGTPKFMAPEIEDGNGMPTIATDRHSLAVLIYQLFFLRHPLEGPKVHDPDPAKDDKLAFGSRAQYIEHPTDRSNRPNPLPFSTEMLTSSVKKLFDAAFVTGLHSPAQRPQPMLWESALLRMNDRLVNCSNPSCPMKSFVLPYFANPVCPWCKTPMRTGSGAIPVLDLFRPAGTRPGNYVPDNWSIAGTPGRQVFLYHADANESPRHGVTPKPVAHLETTAAGTWYLVNEGLDDAKIASQGRYSPFGKGDKVELRPNLKILLGAGEQSRVASVQLVPTHK